MTELLVAIFLPFQISYASCSPPSLLYSLGFILKVPYYTVFHQYIIGLRYVQNMSLKCLARNTKQIIAESHNPLCFSPVSKVLILCLLL